MRTHQGIIPMLAYEDGNAALDWLVKVFGFTEQARWLDDSGRLTHGEIALDGETIMLSSPSPHFQSPKSLKANYPPAAEWLEVPYIFTGVLVHVPDVDAHFARAKAAGATILSDIEEGFPGRRY